MITITRSLARHVRAVFRRAGIKPRGGNAPPILFHAGRDGLRVRAVAPEVALEYHLPDACPEEEITAPVNILDDCQGRSDDSVTIESRPKKKVVTTWHDHGIPQQTEYDLPEVRESFPAIAEHLAVVEQSFWASLREAAECTDRESIRYALGNILLRGEGGMVTAADGHQLYQHRDFQFPWSGDVMIPALGVLGCPELSGQGPIEIGTTERSVCLRIARWTLLLTIDATGRFPPLDQVFVDAESGGVTLRVPAADAEFLAAALPRLPQSEDSPERPITLDLNRQVCVRAVGTGDSAPMTELVLTGATVAGEPLRIETDRCYVERALQLGFTAFRLTSADRAVMAFDDHRRYIWMPLSPDGALAPVENATRIVSTGAEGGASLSSTSGSKTKLNGNLIGTEPEASALALTVAETGMTSAAVAAETSPIHEVPASLVAATHQEPLPVAAAGQRRRSRRTAKGSAAGPIEQAIALRNVLRESVTKTNELIRALKRQRQQSRLVQTTLASLKELQRAG